jgi:hypothetical protein
MIGTRPDTDFEDRLAAMPRKLSDLVDERLDGVAVLFDALEPFQRAGF